MISPVSVIFGLLSCFCQLGHANIPVFNIGGVLSTQENKIILQETVENINRQLLGFHFNATSIIMAGNPMRAALSVCEDLIPQQIYSVIVSHPPDNDLSPVSVSYTCGFYTIPVIGISARESAFSDKNVHKTFVRTVPPYSHQVDVWIELLKNFAWKQVIFMHSADEEGWAMLNRFQLLADESRIGDDILKIEKIIKFPSGSRNYTEALSVISSLQSRVILLYASTEDSQTLFNDAMALNLTDASYAWIVTEQALNAPNIPVGIIGASLVNSSNESAHIKDAVSLLAQAFKELLSKNNLTAPYSQCRENSIPWTGGTLIYRHLQEAKLKHGATGQVSFNSQGDRLNPVYEIINIHPAGKIVVGLFGSTQPWAIVKPLILRDSVPIVYPGNVNEKPKGVVISTHLKVLTLREKPFVEAEIKTKEECDFYQVPNSDMKYQQVYCPSRNTSTGEVTEYCCWGYCVDMLVELAANVNFTFDVELDETGFYGSFERCNDTNEKEWNGMMGQLVRGNADMIVAPLTVNPERAQYIDFSKPFKYQGLTILVKKTVKESSLASFLQPFEDTLWILVGLSVHVVALVLYLLDRFSPFGRFKLAKSDDTEEDALNLSSAMWFAWGVLLNSGIGEGTPRSFSARVLGMVWAGFAMIIVASYTANLAAFLVLDRPEASISGIDDARLRNPQEKFRYATVRNSAVDMYFKRQVELSTMRRTMEPENYDNAELAIQAVKEGNLQAFIWDSSRLQYEAAKECDLVTAGELFGRSAYGIGLQKGSPWKESVSLAILNFHESGYMEKLDSRFIVVRHATCPERDSAPATLGLTNMAGVFMMVAGGIVAGVLLIFVEIAYKRHRGLKDKELELARNAADRWRGNIEKRRTLRQTLQKQREEQTKRNCLESGGQSVVGTPPMNPPSFEEAMTYPIHPQSHRQSSAADNKPRGNQVEDNVV